MGCWALGSLLLAGPLGAETFLEQLVRGTDATPALSGLQVSLMRAGVPAESIALGFARHSDEGVVPLRRDHKVRVASISKLVVAIGVMKLVEAEKLDLDTDVSEYLGFTLRNPAFPDIAITTRQLLSHTSSVRDGSGYFIKAGEGSLSGFFDPESDLWDGGAHFADPAPEAPGQFFTYSNLNFGLLGTIIERLSGQRFDEYMADQVLKPMGLSARFSPCDIDPEQRAAGFRKRPVDAANWSSDGPWVAQVDGGDVQCFYGMDNITLPDEFLSHYQLGNNASLFSPQGGLRASADDLVQILRVLSANGALADGRMLEQASVTAMLAPQWTLDRKAGNGVSAGEAAPTGPTDGLMTSYGLSVHRINPRDWGFGQGPALLLGHLGEAYGILSMALYDPASGDGIAAIITGTADDPAKHRGQSPLYRVEEELLRWWLGQWQK